MKKSVKVFTAMILATLSCMFSFKGLAIGEKQVITNPKTGEVIAFWAIIAIVVIALILLILMHLLKKHKKK